MTYVIGWKSQNAVFLAADTALTSPPDRRTAHVTMSSFGQSHVAHNESEGLIVEERVLKLFLRRDIGLAFAGSYLLALRLAATFYESIESGANPRAALDAALFANRIQGDDVVQLAIAYHSDGPKLLSLNASARGADIVDDQDFVQLGNPLPIHRELTNKWVGDALQQIPHDSRTHLASLLGIFQSYNLFSPQMERGIGGAFCGLYVDETGGNWQPDILYVEYGGDSPKNVGICFRHNSLIINSPVIGQSRSFSNWLPPNETQSTAFTLAQKAVLKGKRLNRTAEYEYIAMIAVTNLTVTVIEMRRRLQHALIWLKYRKDEEGSGTQMTIFPQLRRLMEDTGKGLKVVSYAFPQIRRVPEQMVKRTKIRYE